MQQVNVFIETSSRFRGNVERKCGYVLSTQLRTGKATREHFGRVTGTYHQAILLTMVDALDHMTRTCDVCFYISDLYVTSRLGKITEMAGSGWLDTKGKPIANREEWRRLFKAINQLPDPHKISAKTEKHSYSASGKTISMSLSFVMWAMSTFTGQNFAMCGKTIGSFRRNVLFWLKLMLRSRGYSITDHRADNLLTIRKDGKENYFYIFGGKDERSQDLIQGITLAGVFFDEVALMPESFVNQATGRCSVKGSKFWFNCNPDGPYHWFKQNWIDKSTGYLGKEETARRMQQAAAEGKDPGLKDILYLHFTMDDNLSLDEEIKARYRSMYVGVFFKRYIMGLWAAAEGIIYDMFDENKHVQHIKDFYQLLVNGNRYVSCDYGTQNATVFLLWNKGTNGKWYCIREYYYSGRDKGKQKTDSEYADDLKEWLDGTKIKAIIVDPSAASFIAELRKRGYKVLKANNDVLDGIRLVGMLLNLEKIVFASSCKETIKEFASYIWDEKALERGEDKPVKQFDHCLTGDTLIDTVKGKIPIEKLVGKKGKVYCYDVKRRKRAISTFYNVRKTRKNADIYKLTLEDGNSIKMTADHLVYTQRGWVALKHLKATDKILKVTA